MGSQLRLTKPPLLWKRGAAWLAFLGPFFFLGYGWLNYLTSGRNDIGIMVEPWEHYIPFVPWLMLPYMSIDAFYGVSLFLFRKRSALDRHALRLLLATVISLIGFLLYPLQFSFTVPKAEGFNGMLQALLLGFDKPYNQAPSLHISLLIILWVVYAKKLQSFARLALHAWFAAIAASVLLVYQHHFIDIWTGALVGIVCLYLIPDRPFFWRWKAPTDRMKKIALRYALGAILLLMSGLFLSRISSILTIIFIWISIALSLVAAAYYGFEQQVFQRHNGQMRWPARLLLAPYLLGAWLSYRHHTKQQSLFNQVHDNIWLGAFPSTHTRQMNWAAVLDLTNEFPVSPIKAPSKKYLPVMDLTAPNTKALVRAVHWLDNAQQQGNVLVHCALGVSRSASVVVCWLVWRGYATSIQEAITHVSSLRPNLLLNSEHQKNICQALLQLNNNGSAQLT
ncbi:phosphatase PAP2/dual specificity phosphatase family protein [Methylotenera sp. N17]|uniref:phosphatase PAP2/dual specificity phosphatase family protein n=1 Tax=Methylotenera sp. N17 TaxID=1502761 RepID=UPI000646B28B|nr:phosphatase PAP2/dual specificity phosphatase family protein [Methylotenera sp. N17]